ncbi:uncharacterized protein LOC134834550 [Culicoides brevitarsis]|uniref:uncharacterized protein LOC134834550 n=1 Tax=Culicoides brevitarsis TaxID=469753 RepID=UPI00307BEC05
MKRKSDVLSSPNKRPKIENELFDLPSQILEKILTNLTPKQRRTLMAINKSWSNFCSEKFPKDSCLVFHEKTDFSYNGALYQSFSKCRVMRTFKHLLIESLPIYAPGFEALCRLINLDDFGPKILDLKIMEMASYPGIDENWCNKIYAMMPNLQTLEIAHEELLGDLTNLDNCQSIKLHGVMQDMQKLGEIRKMKKLKSFVCGSIEVHANFRDFDVGFMSVKLKKLLKDLLGNAENGRFVQLKSDFNFKNCRSKLTPESITEMKFKNGISSAHFNPWVLLQFPNLKTLKIRSVQIPDEDDELYLMFLGVTKLELSDVVIDFRFTNNTTNFFRKFPDLEYLKLTGFRLENEDFEEICEHMPKLKELVLLNGRSGNEINPRTIMNHVKKLTDLEKLVIETREEDVLEDFFMPYLPKLRELSLTGDCFNITDEDWIPMILWNQLYKLTINTNGVFCSNWAFPFFDETHFTHLTLPGEGKRFDYRAEDYFESGVPNFRLSEDIACNCYYLQELTIEDDVGFSLAQELKMFRYLPELEKITCLINSEEYKVTRVMERKDFLDLKRYLKKNIHYYPNLLDTTSYVAQNVMTENAYADIWQSVQQMYGEAVENMPEDGDLLKNLIIVTKYIGLNHIDYCQLLNNMYRLNDN